VTFYFEVCGVCVSFVPMNNPGSVNNDFRLSNLSKDKFTYIRMYNKYGYLLDGLSSNAYVLLMSLLQHSDASDGLVHWYVKGISVSATCIAYRNVKDTDYNYRRRRQRAMRELIECNLVKKVRNSFGTCIMINPYVGYMSDYRGRKLAIQTWDELVGKSNDAKA